MPELQWKILDEEAVTDPEVLVEILGELLGHARQLEGALALAAGLLLMHLGELPEQDRASVEGAAELLKQFMDVAFHNGRNGQLADQVRDLLEAQE